MKKGLFIYFIMLICAVMACSSAKKNDVMAFIKCSDEYKEIDLTLFPKEYKLYNNLKAHDIIDVYGKIEKRLDNIEIIVSRINKLSKE